MALLAILVLSSGTALANACLVLDSEVPAHEVAGSLQGHGCFVGRADAFVDWELSRAQIGSRNVIVTLQSEGETTLTLMGDGGQELNSITADHGVTEADWVLAPGVLRYRIEHDSGDRFVVRTRAGNWRTTVDSQHRSSDSRIVVRGRIEHTGLVDHSPYYLTWELREDGKSC